jgi:hypothetical protein
VTRGHLAQIPAEGRTFGRLEHDGRSWIVHAEPSVLEVARRVFPGANLRHRERVSFVDTTRQVEDLLWLLVRFPLDMDDGTRLVLEESRARVLALDERRGMFGHRVLQEPPGFCGELRPFQRSGAAFLLDGRKCILADDMGLGKTVEALAAYAERGGRMVVVCPPNVVLQWSRQIDVFLARRFGGWTQILRGLTPGPIDETPIKLIHWLLVAAWADDLIAWGPDVVIFDEAQELRTGKSNKYAGASRLSAGVPDVWGLSGTPIYNYGSEIFSVMNAIESGCIGSRHGFDAEWAPNGRIVEKPEVLGDYLKREGLLLRRTKKDVQTELPPKRRVVQRIDHDDDVYSGLVRKTLGMVERLREGVSYFERGRIVAQIDRETRMACGMAKARFVAGFVHALIAGGERPLVYSHHHDVHDEIAGHLVDLGGYRLVQITGRQTQKQKDANVTAFGAGRADACLLGLRSTAGLDGLQGAGTAVVFAELDWSPAVHGQCEDRLHRIGMRTDDELICYYLVSQLGYDGTMLDALGLKVGQFTAMMGDDPESEEDRSLAGRAAEDRIERVIMRVLANQDAA